MNKMPGVNWDPHHVIAESSKIINALKRNLWFNFTKVYWCHLFYVPFWRWIILLIVLFPSLLASVSLLNCAKTPFEILPEFTQVWRQLFTWETFNSINYSINRGTLWSELRPAPNPPESSKLLNYLPLHLWL